MSKRFIYSFLLCVLPSQIFADIGFYETEPNDTPADFHPVSGEITLYGTMVGQDQDGFLWTVTDNDARKRWTFRLNGEPGALTIAQVVRLEYAENGVDVSGKRTLFKMGTRDGVTPSIHADLQFEPGEYVIGLAQAGAGSGGQSNAAFRPPVGTLSFGDPEPQSSDESAREANAENPTGATPPPNTEVGAYRLMITEAKKIHPQPNPKGRDSKENAYKLRLGGEFSTFDLAETSWYKLIFNEKDAANRWDLHVQAPIGRHLRVRLLDANGEELLEGSVDDKGKLRFPDLAPSADTTWYLALTTREPGFIHAISTEAVGHRISGEEAEPNSVFRFANRLTFGETVSGRIGGDDSTDYFKFTTDETAADEQRTLRVETDPPIRIQLCLTTGKQAQVQCRSGDAPLELPDLALDPGEWAVSVARAAAEATYTLSWIKQGPVQAGTEVEPNDLIQHAKGMPNKLRIKGRFSGDDTDFYEIMVADEPQLWRFQVIGDEIFEVGYYDGSLQQKDMIRAKPRQRRVRLENLFLLPGRHFIRVQGRDGGEYTLLARALGPPDPNGEMEPNDQHNKQLITVGQTRSGLSGDERDLDYYRFFVGNWDHLRLTITPPADGILAPNVYWYDNMIGQGMPSTTPGEPMVMQGLFPPGDYHVVLHPRQVSDAEYTISLERLPRFSCPSDCEPNGHGPIWLTAPLPADLVVQGNSGDWRDTDIYQIPAFNQSVEMHMRSSEPVRLRLGKNIRSTEWPTHDPEFGGYNIVVPAGDPYLLIIESHGEPYRLELAFPNGEIQPVSGPLPAQLDLKLDEDSVSAYRQHGQRLGGVLTLSNSDPAPVEVRLEAVTSDYRWRVQLDTDTVTIAPDGNASVPVTVLAPSDAWAIQPVRISIRAIDASGRQAETFQELVIDRDKPAVNPVMHWNIPEALRGGLNAAWLPFNAEWTDSTPDWATRTDTLRDGLVFGGLFLSSGYYDGQVEEERPELTIDLPGEDLVPVAGTAINNFGTPGPFFDIRKATLLLSTDGLNFEEVLSFEALPVETEQQFALESPVPARFARLRIDSTFGEPSTDRLTMAEWKVILEPGYDLSSGEGFNIADPMLGGHMVWDWPAEPYSPRRVLTPDDVSLAAYTGRGPTKDYVIGFRQNRAAQITGIDWLYADDAREEWKSFERIDVAVSLESPVGPWLPLGELAIDPENWNGKLELPEPSWARFVRLTAHRNPEIQSAMEPGQILIHERPNGNGYLTVLGEWGTKGQRAFYELQQGLEAEAVLVATDNTTRQRAATLKPATPTAGQVSLGKLEHWYLMTVPEGENTLSVTMHGDPTVRTVVELENTAGDAIPLRRIDEKMLPGRHEFEAVVEPGSEVYFRIFEPPRNVAFTWDTSASVSAYISLINNAIVAFSGQVVPGREAVNLFPFPTGPLLDEWLGEPYMLQTILNDYRGRSSSSSAEYTLKIAAQGLGPLAGTKAIVVITDGDVPHDGNMWGPFQEVQPRVFSVHVAGDTMYHQQVMRDWASVNGGHFTQLVYDGEMEVAFDRTTTLMHRPAGYMLLVESEFREAPGPGYLRVVAGEESDAAAGAVELILDASGSMWQKLDGRFRIDIAKDVLTSAIEERIPPGTPTALRVFGHRKPNACDTNLEISLQPLDIESAIATVNGITPQSLAKTPIAASLAAVSQDLSGMDGKAVVVLVTDGKETCDGNPEAEIQRLVDAGFKLSLNIVGFAIDDNDLAAQFAKWAATGGGRYFAANDAAGLDRAMAQALAIPFTVYDQSGAAVVESVVGGTPIELKQGIYRVVVNSTPARTFDDVEIAGGSDTELSL